MNPIIALVGDPLGRWPWRKAVYALLAIYFGRLALWYAIEDRWGRA